MTSKQKKKEKREIPLRASGESIVKAEDRPSKVLYDLAIAAEEKQDLPPPTTPHHPVPPPTTKTTSDVSPKRDYTKVANSINRNAVPSGLFKGTSKTTYDILYQRTRGAINPRRSIKAVQGDVLIWTNLSHNTLRSHLKHLQSVGLVIIHYKLGDNDGAEYEVFLPEEIESPTTPYHPLPPPTTSTQELVGGTYQNLVVGGGGVTPENIGQSESLKTSLKTNTRNDDEPFGGLIDVLTNTCERVCGHIPQKSDRAKWKELAELLAMELEIAAARTGSISSVPAFLTEHLRRRLIQKLNTPKPKSNKPVSNTSKKSKPSIYEAESLSEQGREVVLKTFKEYIEKGQRDFVMSFEETYTKGDWSFLMSNL